MAVEPNFEWANQLTDYAMDEDWTGALGEINALPPEEHESAMFGLLKLRAADLERVKEMYREAFTVPEEPGICPHCGLMIDLTRAPG
jgi:hypothetical protein